MSVPDLSVRRTQPDAMSAASTKPQNQLGNRGPKTCSPLSNSVTDLRLVCDFSAASSRHVRRPVQLLSAVATEASVEALPHRRSRLP